MSYAIIEDMTVVEEKFNVLSKSIEKNVEIYENKFKKNVTIENIDRIELGIKMKGKRYEFKQSDKFCTNIQISRYVDKSLYIFGLSQTRDDETISANIRIGDRKKNNRNYLVVQGGDNYFLCATIKHTRSQEHSKSLSEEDVEKKMLSRIISINGEKYVKWVSIEDPDIEDCLNLIGNIYDLRKGNALDMQAESSNPIPEKIMSNRNNEIPTEKNNIYDYYSINGFVFSDEIITRYVLSLMTKPFVILTGISGTGKTKIAQLFASYMLQECDKEEIKRRIAFVPVRPDWLDNKGLLGFFNILDEKYNATPLLKLLLAARDNPSKPYFVILDEMNLAKVEHYFSDFLSIMESRTPDNPQGEALVLHDRSEAYTHDGLLIPDRLHIPANVYFTGTVNVDESTYMFSPKVLDRANVIEFNEVFLDHQVDNQTYSNSFCFKQRNLLDVFPLSEDQPFSSSNDYSECKHDCPHVVDGLSELHNKLKEHNMHFGYRVINEVCRFTRLANTYVSPFDSDTVLDIQVVQKILPKFHGTQAKLDEPLKKLHDFAQSPASLLTSRTVDYRLPRTSDKLTAMLDTLKKQGYADFIE